MNQEPKTKKGFTLVEAIVAIGVISIGFVGSLVLLAKSSSQANVLKDRVIAAHLAEEGIEVVRNIRDTNWLKGFGWLNGLSNTTNGTVNYDSPAIVNSDSQCLNWNGSFYLHTYTPICNTSFERYIKLETKPETISGSNINYLEVKSVVKWREKGSPKTITVIDHLYDWK